MKTEFLLFNSLFLVFTSLFDIHYSKFIIQILFCSGLSRLGVGGSRLKSQIAFFNYNVKNEKNAKCRMHSF